VALANLRYINALNNIMNNRVPGILDKLSSDKDLQKRGTGACDVVRQDSKMAVVKWFHNKPIVTIGYPCQKS